MANIPQKKTSYSKNLSRKFLSSSNIIQWILSSHSVLLLIGRKCYLLLFIISSQHIFNRVWCLLFMLPWYHLKIIIFKVQRCVPAPSIQVSFAFKNIPKLREAIKSALYLNIYRNKIPYYRGGYFKVHQGHQ